MQQRRDVTEQLLQSSKGNFTYFAILQRHSVAMVPIGADGIHSQQLAGHLETGDLLLAVRRDLIRFQMPKPDSVKISERVSHPVKIFVSRYPAAASDNLIEPVDVRIVQAHRQA